MEISGGSNYYDNHLISFFSKLEDPRRTSKGNIKHNLTDMIFLVVSAVVCGANDWKSIHTFGVSQLEWLRKFGSFENGIPSKDTISRVFTALDHSKVNSCFVEWAKSHSKLSDGEVVAIDGKRIRRSYDKRGDKNAIHMVSAFACENGISLGQIATKEKSNEITAIPKLLDMLTIAGTTVTIDAMGCQTDIAEKVIDKEADYILAVKENQKELYEQVKKLFKITRVRDCHEDIDSGHGRIETRKSSVIDQLDFLDEKEKWSKLKTIIMVESEQYDQLTQKQTKEVRYYISSSIMNAEKFNHSIRSHWYIENKLHWVLDVNFKEDYGRRRKGYSASNFNALTKMAMAYLKNGEINRNTSLAANRFKAALDVKFREKLLNL